MLNVSPAPISHDIDIHVGSPELVGVRASAFVPKNTLVSMTIEPSKFVSQMPDCL